MLTYLGLKKQLKINHLNIPPKKKIGNSCQPLLYQKYFNKKKKRNRYNTYPSPTSSDITYKFDLFNGTYLRHINTFI